MFHDKLAAVALSAAVSALAFAACLSPHSPSQDGVAEPAEPPPPPRRCGGIAGIHCPAGFTCLDDPSDSCDPLQGGRDCSGLCIVANVDDGGDEPQCDDAQRKYVSHDGAQCATLSFHCDPDEIVFFDDCGCGCEPRGIKPCGLLMCNASQYCCNPSCGICAPLGGSCIQTVCNDGPGRGGDYGGF
jgi:hypothetical protein